jgi:hypothetical protein
VCPALIRRLTCRAMNGIIAEFVRIDAGRPAQRQSRRVGRGDRQAG